MENSKAHKLENVSNWSRVVSADGGPATVAAVRSAVEEARLEGRALSRGMRFVLAVAGGDVVVVGEALFWLTLGGVGEPRVALTVHAGETLVALEVPHDA